MKIFTDLLRRKEPTAADLREALDGLHIPAKAAAVADVQARRRAMLLDGEPGPALDEVEREIVQAQREHDRAVALDEELRARIETAVLRERVDALAARKAEVEQEASAAAKAMARDYPDLIDQLAALVARDRAARIAIRAVNADLAAIGSTERVAEPPTPPVRLIDRMNELVPGGLTGFGV